MSVVQLIGRGQITENLDDQRVFELESFIENFILLLLGNKDLEKKGALS